MRREIESIDLEDGIDFIISGTASVTTSNGPVNPINGTICSWN